MGSDRRRAGGARVGSTALALSAVLGTALGLGLAGCSDGAPEPEPLPSPSDTASATSSASPTHSSTPGASASPADAAPTMPAAARGTTPAAAEAFGRYYVDVINYSLHSGNTNQLKRLSGNNCATCAVIVDEVRGIYSKGGHIQGGAWRATKRDFVTKRAASVRAKFEIDIAKQVVFKTAHAKPSASNPTGGSVEFYLRPSNDSWRVDHLVARS